MTKTTKQQRRYPRVSIDFGDQSVVQRHQRESCDINNIVETYARTGIDPNPDGQTNQKFGFATSKDFTESAYHMAEIKSAFADLPSATRSHFANDPARWLDAVQKAQSQPDEIDPSEPSQERSEPAPEPTETEPMDIT